MHTFSQMKITRTSEIVKSNIENKTFLKQGLRSFKTMKRIKLESN